MAEIPVADSLLAPNANQEWTVREAAHLLSRAQFGFTPDVLKQAVSDGLNATIDRLLSPQAETVEFQHAEAALKTTAASTAEISDLKIWWLYRMWSSANPLAEKMSLFWHNHFATSYAKVRSVPQMLAQNELIRSHSLGDFKQMMHGISRDPAMLIWLDGNANRKRHPNENFAREIMELFTLGVGNYTEKDIQEAARAFSGWHMRNGSFWFNALQHDETSKTVFGSTGQFDGTAIVNLCLAQPACPRFLAMKLLKAFVCSEPSPEMIDAVAARIGQHDFQMSAVLRELLTSRLFFDPVLRRSIIKSPLDLVVGSLRSLAETVKWPQVAKILGNLGQDVFEPPSVKGWEGGRLWVNSSTILLRTNFATELASGDHLATLRTSVNSLADQSTDAVVSSLEQWLLGNLFTTDLHTELQSQHQRAEGDGIQKLRTLLQLMLSLPEFQLH